ncbi:MAG: hypothetical protein M3436_01820 [Pseudomonadota bacterium]|nr:hypothetical protein [Pseudomonadota bacterium]
MPPIVEGTMNVVEKPDVLVATGRSRTNLSVLHFLSAARFSRHVKGLEETHRGQEFGAFWEEILAYSTATLLTTVAALEAFANELFVDYPTVFPELRPEVMAKLWELYEQKPPLEKFEIALLLKQGQTFDRGTRPYQDVYALVRLRNGLTHFKPEWDNEQEHGRISALLSGRISVSPFFSSPEPLFPRGWASYSCTDWAMESALRFLLEFERRANLHSRLAPFVDRIRAP